MKHTMLRILACSLVLTFSTALSAAEKGDRDQAMALLAGADELIKSNSHPQAIELLKRALQADATCPQAHFKMGVCLEASNKPRDAFKSYQAAAQFARKENDMRTASAADQAGKKIGTGLMQIAEADTKVVPKLMDVGNAAMADEQFETARTAFSAVLSINANHQEAQAAMEKVEKALAERGDPVKQKIAEAMLKEVFYYVSQNQKDQAKRIAQDLIDRHGSTAPGREAAQLVANDFVPRDIEQEIAEAKRVLKERAEKAKKAAAVKPATTTTTTTPTPRVTDAKVGQQNIDVDAMEKVASEDAKKLGKGDLIVKYKETFRVATDAFAKAKPGSEGNQKNLAAALENLIRCEALYMRIEEESLANDEVKAMQKQAGATRYSCMKMTVLSH